MPRPKVSTGPDRGHPTPPPPPRQRLRLPEKTSPGRIWSFPARPFLPDADPGGSWPPHTRPGPIGRSPSAYCRDWWCSSVLCTNVCTSTPRPRGREGMRAARRQGRPMNSTVVYCTSATRSLTSIEEGGSQEKKNFFFFKKGSERKAFRVRAFFFFFFFFFPSLLLGVPTVVHGSDGLCTRPPPSTGWISISSQGMESLSREQTSTSTSSDRARATPMESTEPRADLPRPYQCPLCEKAFHRLEHQTRHIRTHTGEKPHACHFSGCTKRFSRSDELTRHSRIHNNPNGRRSHRVQPASTGHAIDDRGRTLQMNEVRSLVPPSSSSSSSSSSESSSSESSSESSSAESSGTYVTGLAAAAAPRYHVSHHPSPASSVVVVVGPTSTRDRPGPERMSPLDINLLATAACQVERDPPMSTSSSSSSLSSWSSSTRSRPRPYGGGVHPPPLHHHHHYPLGRTAFATRPTTRSMSDIMSRSRSHEDDGPGRGHVAKRSRPSSPSSTAPSSPTFSHDDSCSPTPDHTPLATPAHSPRLRPFGGYHGGGGATTTTTTATPSINSWTHDFHLPGLRHLSLQPSAVASNYHLAPLEPPLPPPPSAMTSTSNLAPPPILPLSGGGRLRDILSRPDGTQRKLPLPTVTVVQESSTSYGESIERD